MPTLLNSCITKCEHIGKSGTEKWCNEDTTGNCWKGYSLQKDLLLITHWCFQKKSLECMEFSGMPGCKHDLVNQGLKICCPVTIDYSESKIAYIISFWEVLCSTQTARSGGIISHKCGQRHSVPSIHTNPALLRFRVTTIMKRISHCSFLLPLIRKLEATAGLTTVMLFPHGSALEADPGADRDEKQQST